MPDQTQTTVPLHEDTRKQVARFLPDALAKALTSYYEFMGLEIPKTTPQNAEEPQTNSSEFERHHKACKAAIAHIELLIKLAEWAQLPDAAAPDHNQQILLSAVLQEARAEIKHTKKDDDE